MWLTRTIARACLGALVACLVAACSGGGGGGGGTPPQFVVSPANLSFSAADPNAPRPASKPIMASVNGVNADTLFVRIVITGPAVTAVDNLVITGPNSGQMMVHVADPGTIGPGNHSSVLTVSACTTDVNCSGAQLTGSPATISVAYQVGAVPPPPDAVAPSVGTANVQGAVVIRGNGFVQGTVVSFGGTPAMLTAFVSPTEIQATYPGLAAGTYPITLNGGATAFSGSLHIVPADNFVTASLPFPSLPQELRGLAYDARRQALFVGAGFLAPANNEVLRYAFSGGAWQAPQRMTLANARDLTLSLDGEKLLAITDTALAEINAGTFVTQATTVRTSNPLDPFSPRADEYLKSIVAANDGQALVVSSSPNFGELWLYDVARRTFSVPRNSYHHPIAGGPANGSRVVFLQGGVSPAQPAQQYSASSGLVAATPLAVAYFFGSISENINPPVFDRSGTRMMVTGGVYDRSFTELGQVPSGNDFTTGVRAAYALSADGGRAYTLEIGTAACSVRAFDLGTSPFTELTAGFPIDLMPDCPASTFDVPIRMVVNPAGNTLFIAGSLLIRVVRLP